MTFVTVLGDISQALGAGARGVSSGVGNVGGIVGVAANSFSLGNAVANMYQQGPTVQNVVQAGNSTVNLALIGVVIAQPETAPFIGAYFVGEMFVTVLTK